jgi:T4-like virus tail tube protein gp19
MPVNAFNISNFLSEIQKTGVLHTNKFMVDILSGNSDLVKSINLRAENVNIPGVSLDITQVKRYGIGPIQKIATGIIFPDVSISFIDDSVNTVWKYLYQWFNGIFQYTGNSNKPLYTFSYKDNYVADILIHIYSNDGTEVTRINLKEAFPTILGDVSMGWSNNNQIFKVQANFAYTEWEEVSIASKMPAPGPVAQSTPLISVPSNYYSSIAATPPALTQISNYLDKSSLLNNVVTPANQNTDQKQNQYAQDYVNYG